MKRILLILSIFILAACSPHDNESSNFEGKLKMQSKKMSDINSGYLSSENDWSDFLGCWREEVVKRLKEKSRIENFPSSENRVLVQGTAEYEENENEILKFETVKKIKLPKSYRDFALISGQNWWVESASSLENDSYNSNFLRVDRIGKFMDIDKLNWGGWNKAIEGETIDKTPPERYYRYGYYNKSSEEQDGSSFRWEYLNSLIKVGELEQGAVLLLNPNEITQDGEWEAWLLSTQIGANRYRSFAELMQYVAYQDIYERGGVALPAEKLRTTCARHLKTAATQ